MRVSPGDVFDRWTVIAASDDPRHHPRWICECACGKRKSVLAQHLTAGRSRSCGCLQAEVASAERTAWHARVKLLLKAA